MKKSTYIVLITLVALVLITWLLVQNQSAIIELLPVDEQIKIVLVNGGIFTWLVIAPVIYVGTLVGVYLPRVKKLKKALSNKDQ